LRKYKTVFLDFDETIFNHYDFLKWALGVLDREGLVSEATMLNSIDAYHDEIRPRHRVYGHIKHYKEKGSVDWHHVSGIIARAYPKQECMFCYDDAHILIDHLSKTHNDVRILSFGDEAYQRFKMSFCKKIRDLNIPIHVVTEPKRVYFKTYTQQNQKYLLVDDKADLGLAVHVDHAHIDRTKQEERTKKGNIISVSSLQNLIGYDV
jgi:hypothetical protein